MRSLPRRHDQQVFVAVAVDVEHGERPTVLIEVEPDGARHIVEASLTVVAQEHVPLTAGDRAVDQELIDRAPGVIIRSALDACKR